MLMIAAANRDPAQFPEPDRLDVRRKELRHPSFGMGPHYCVGAALGRVEAEETFAALLRRFPRMQVALGTQGEEGPGRGMGWRNSVMARRPVRLQGTSATGRRA